MGNLRGRWGERERCDSEGSVEEHTKRKTEVLGRDPIEREKGVADIFRKSKKVIRSPEG